MSISIASRLSIRQRARRLWIHGGWHPPMIDKHNCQQILSKLNNIYDRESSDLDPTIATMQFMSLSREEQECTEVRFDWLSCNWG